MIKSMTGYGRQEGAWRAGSLTVELRAVNHRFCEVVVRLPRFLSSLEDAVKRTVLRRVLRGRVEVSGSLQGGRESVKTVSLDRSLAKQYHRALRDLQRHLGVGGTIDLAMLAGARELISVTEQPLADDRDVQRTLLRLVGRALSDLDAMRRREGGVLSRDIKKRVQVIGHSRTLIERRVPAVVQAYFSRMKSRVEKLLGGESPDLGRLNQELALYADRCDVTEEVIRLGSHLAQFGEGLKGRDAVGRTLDFLLQEMGREVNTIGSKANDAQITVHVVRMKGELEKIREQVQNIE